MASRVLRSLFFIWLCCYLSGPLIQMIDSWDSPQEELVDIASSSSGILVWLAGAIAVAISVFRDMCESCHVNLICVGDALAISLRTLTGPVNLILPSPPLRN